MPDLTHQYDVVAPQHLPRSLYHPLEDTDSLTVKQVRCVFDNFLRDNFPYFSIKNLCCGCSSELPLYAPTTKVL